MYRKTKKLIKNLKGIVHSKKWKFIQLLCRSKPVRLMVYYRVTQHVWASAGTNEVYSDKRFEASKCQLRSCQFMDKNPSNFIKKIFLWRWTKVLWVWNDLRVSKWQNFHIWLSYSFKSNIIAANPGCPILHLKGNLLPEFSCNPNQTHPNQQINFQADVFQQVRTKLCRGMNGYPDT